MRGIETVPPKQVRKCCMPSKMHMYHDFCRKASTRRRCLDIDECTENIHACDESTQCKNERGTYRCKCPPGMIFYGYTCHDINECFAGTHSCTPSEQCANIIVTKEFKGVGYRCFSENESEKQFSEAQIASFEHAPEMLFFEIEDTFDDIEFFKVEEALSTSKASSFPKKLCIQYFGGSIEKILAEVGVDPSRWIIRSMVQDINRLIRHICGTKIQNQSLKRCIQEKGGGENVISTAESGITNTTEWAARMEELIHGRVGECNIIKWHVQWTHRLKRVESNLHKISMEYQKKNLS
ncbi:Oidioi.mRNA.OKI2018_I69.XSR.g15951.t1.cds [Oikopleura dioica]|uniref:Oidioi.mRNA.OKI2018_I69.XSR.g15951.t1.cds n=1 Tax=Oikopleura dioica TaxID=34765 RepID=A0ABN7SF16_OIKDI|nr:Oidioi.mRNA.OKI2018_I69.XSR.g15951.t1.cds [Oikopleura dioica]